MKKPGCKFSILSCLFLLNLVQSLKGAGSPDLAIYGPAATPHVVYRSFATNDCAVNEGCVEPGVRALLAFTSQTRNVGAADLVLGNPATNSLFVFDPCH